MSISRRSFILQTSGTAAAVGLMSPSLGSILKEIKDSPKDFILGILQEKFSKLDVSQPAVSAFAEDLLARPKDEIGSSLTSLEEAADDNYTSVSFERFVCREFALNTNYLLQGYQQGQELVFMKNFYGTQA